MCKISEYQNVTRNSKFKNLSKPIHLAMEQRDTKTSIPLSITDDVIKYLEQQEKEHGEDEGWGLPDQSSGWLRVNSILQEIIGNIANRAQYIEDFEARLKAHNQYPLFDLSTILPDFFIDDTMYEKLTFRENLVISSFQNATNSFVPTIVGGLCLDVQPAKGANPLIRKDIGLEQKIIELVTLKLNEQRKVSNTSGHSKNAGSRQDGPKSPKLPTGSLSKLESEIKITESNQEIQDFITSINPRYERPNCKFLVHVSSQFDVDGHSGGSRITAWVDRNFHTLEEKRNEYIKEDSGMNEKTLYCALQARRYYVKHRSTTEDLLDRKYYSMAKTRDLICEGSNFLLMRYLSMARYIGTFELSTMYINGDMCRDIYECTGPESGIVNNTKLDLCKINRTIIEECGIVHSCITVLTLNGQIVKQEWDGCEYILQVNPLAYISNEKPTGLEHVALTKAWESDMQLLSAFLDQKTTCHMQIKSYLADHPEFKNMIADYVQATLLMKPEEVLDFTIKHFTQYCSENMLRNDSYADEEQLEEEPYFQYW